MVANYFMGGANYFIGYLSDSELVMRLAFGGSSNQLVMRWESTCLLITETNHMSNNKNNFELVMGLGCKWQYEV